MAHGITEFMQRLSPNRQYVQGSAFTANLAKYVGPFRRSIRLWFHVMPMVQRNVITLRAVRRDMKLLTLRRVLSRS